MTSRKQALIDEYLSPRKDGGGSGAGNGKGKGPRASAAVLPPEPPLSEVLGCPLLKDFVDPNTRLVRPFQGNVTSFDKEYKWWQVLYEDGEVVEYDWNELWPLLQRAEVAGLRRKEEGGRCRRKSQVAAAEAAAPVAASKASISPAAAPTGRLQQQAAEAAAAASEGETLPSKKRGRPPKQQSTGGAAAASQPEAVQGKPRGRPPKQEEQKQKQGAAADVEVPQPKKRGRPPKKQQEQQPQEQKEGAAADGEVPQAKKRGRPPKQQQEKGKEGGAAGAAAAAAAAGVEQLGRQSKQQPAAQAVGKAAPAGKPEQRHKQQQQQQQPDGKGKGKGKAGGSGAANKKRNEAPADDGEDSGNDEGGEGGSAPVKRRRKAAAPPVDVPMPVVGRTYQYQRGREPWRSQPSFKWQVHEELDLSAAAVNRVRDVQRQYNKLLIQAEVDEKERVARELEELEASGLLGKKGTKMPSTRPDRAAESRLKAANGTLRGDKVAGHFPGWDVGSRAYSRSELSCIGFHFPPIAGIDYVAQGKAGSNAPAFATSVMISGWYQDDNDEGKKLWYTGEGGNDLLHGRNQVADQNLVRGNKALVGNIQLGIPVRVTRKQKDSHGPFGVAYVYDGLYDVLAYRYVKGKEGKMVYQFQMQRRPGQGHLQSDQVEWGAVSAKRDVMPWTRQGVVDLDISRGQEKWLGAARKGDRGKGSGAGKRGGGSRRGADAAAAEQGDAQPNPIAAVDDTWLLQEHCDSEPHGDLPSCTGLEDVVGEEQLKGKAVRGINQKRLDQLQAQRYRAITQYITQYQYEGRAKLALTGLKPAVLPAEYEANPHAYLSKLNHGRLPYNDKGQLITVLPVAYVCGPWCKCSLGIDCPQAVSRRGIPFRLEIFKTRTGCGWGVRSLDTIPQHSFICLYIGQVYDAAEHEELVRTVEELDAEYTFEMSCRNDTNWDGSEKPPEERESHRAHFVVCGLRKRNVAAWFNHSCSPNCFVQPILDDHHDTRMAKIAVHAMDNIAPMTELTLDYGPAYAANIPGGCRCGAADCISKHRRSPRA